MILRRPAPGSAPRYLAVEPAQPGLRFANLFGATARSLIFLKHFNSTLHLQTSELHKQPEVLCDRTA